MARDSVEIGDVQKIHIISDKIFRDSNKDQLDAIGNVIITYQSNSIYGEKVKINFNSKISEVEGNVRYVGPDITFYGSRLKYNFKDNTFQMENARITSDNYIVLGKKISRISENQIIGKDAEYTTCRDCPEFWSIHGRTIKITVGQYIEIEHAYIKVKGTVIMYIPYIVFPIKKSRQTGLLFPKFSLDLEDGTLYQQPWFWAISPNMDMTLTPSVLGRRGWGSEVQFRHILKDGLWYELNSFLFSDRIYLPNKEGDEISGQHVFRYFSEWEHHYHSYKNWNHHLYYNLVRDLDMNRDFSSYIEKRVQGASLGGESFLDYRTSWLSISTEAYFKRNQIYSETYDFDDRFVQILPKVNMSLIPYPIFQTDIIGLHSFVLDFKTDMTIFKQNKFQEGKYIRNAIRYNINPALTWSFGRLGPIYGKIKATLDYQKYRFPKEKKEKNFKKRGIVYETEFLIEFEKIFGKAYQTSQLQLKNNKNKKRDFDYLGDLPSVKNPIDSRYKIEKRNSYRHLQQIKLKHYFTNDQKISGNQRFYDQIQDLSGRGQFDPVDAIRQNEFLLTNEVSRTTLPLSNTLEFQWNQSLTKKSILDNSVDINSSQWRDKFLYNKMAYLNLSQGYIINNKSGEFIDGLTRLYIDMGLKLDEFSFNINEYYYYTTQEHILTFGISKDFKGGKVFTYLEYDTFEDQVDKFFNVGGEYLFFNQIKFTVFWNYDYEELRTNKSLYKISYFPSNNCWKIGLNYQNKIDEVRLSLNFIFNFNKKNFNLSDEL